VYRSLARKPEGKRPLGIIMHSWEDNIKMDHEETECEGVDWIHLALDNVQWQNFVSTVMNL